MSTNYKINIYGGLFTDHFTDPDYFLVANFFSSTNFDIDLSSQMSIFSDVISVYFSSYSCKGRDSLRRSPTRLSNELVSERRDGGLGRRGREWSLSVPCVWSTTRWWPWPNGRHFNFDAIYHGGHIITLREPIRRIMTLWCPCVCPCRLYDIFRLFGPS